MENDERTEHKRILEDIIRKYAMNTLSGTPRPLTVGSIGIITNGGDTIWADLEEQGFVNQRNFSMKMNIVTAEGDIKIPMKEYFSLVKEIIQELCDEGFLTLTKGKYSLNVSSDEMAAKAYHAQQAHPVKIKTTSTFNKIANVSILGLLVLVFTFYFTGFHYCDDGYWFGDGEMQPWNIPGLSPARGTSGDWSGSYFIEENMGNPSWSAEGGAILDLKHDGNTVTGSYTMENYRSKAISGTISSSHIEFTDGFLRFKGSFTGVTMTLQVESCSLNQYCMDPDMVDKDFTSGGVSGSYAGEAGIKGNLVLYKGSDNLMTGPGIDVDMPDPYAPIGNYPEGYVP